MLRSLLLDGVAFLPLRAPEGEGAAPVEPELPLPGAEIAAGEAGDQAGGEGEGTTEAETAPEASTEAADAEKAAKATEDANKAAAAKRRANAPKWAMDEITSQRAAKRQAEEEAARLRTEVENLRQIAERATTSKDGTQTTTTPPRTTDGRFISPQDPEFQRAVEREATQREFAKATQDIFDAGIKDYQDFQESLNIMTAVGATSDEFAADLVAVDKENAHKLIHELAQTPELSKRLAAMSSRQRVAELTKMSLKMQEVSGKGGGRQVSRAAAPLRALEGTTNTDDTDLGDNVPDEVWSTRFNKKFGLNGAQR